jgi:hypothetical protein
MRLRFIWTIIVGVGLTLGVGPFLFLSAIRQGQISAALLDHGDRTTGQVTEIYVGRRDTTIDYQFSAGNLPYSGVTSAGRSDGSSYRVGQAVPVTYLPEDPSKSSLDPERLGRNATYFKVIAPLLTLLLGPGLIAYAVYRLRQF